MRFKQVSDDELRDAGFDPACLDPQDDDPEGPYAPIRVPSGASCHHCGGPTLGYTVVDLSTATGIEAEWTHDDGMVDAQEKADELNRAWSRGYETAVRQVAK